MLTQFRSAFSVSLQRMAKKTNSMHSNINGSTTEQDRQQTEKTISRYKLYNLLFAGRIRMEEYLKALRELKNDNSEADN